MLADQLQAAHDLLSKHWTRGALARRRDNLECPADDPLAVKWCALGALRKLQVEEDAIKVLIESTVKLYSWHLRGRSAIVAANDGFGKNETLGLFEHAINKLRTTKDVL
jgi:hypothetical protein